MARLGCTVARQDGWLLVAHPQLQWPLYNYATPGTGAGDGETGVPDPVRAAARLESHHRLPCFLTPAAAPAPLPGLTRIEQQQVWQTDRPPAGPRRQPDGVRAWPLPPALTPLWVDLMLDGFAIPPAMRPPLAAAWEQARSRLAPGERLDLYLAEINGNPAGTGALFMDAHGVAGLYGGAVLPAYRRSGLGSMLVEHRLTAAFCNGARLALTQTASDSGIGRIWERLGAASTDHLVQVWYPT